MHFHFHFLNGIKALWAIVIQSENFHHPPSSLPYIIFMSLLLTSDSSTTNPVSCFLCQSLVHISSHTNNNPVSLTRNNFLWSRPYCISNCFTSWHGVSILRTHLFLMLSKTNPVSYFLCQFMVPSFFTYR